MAVRARSSGGAVGFAVALVIVSVFFVFSLILAIVYYTQVEDAKNARLEAEKRQRSVILESELSDPLVVELRNNAAAGSVVGQLMSQIKALRSQIDSETVTLDQINNARKATGLRGPFLAEIRRLLAEINDKDGQVAAITADLNRARVALRDAQEETSKVKAQFQQDVDGLRQKLEQEQQRNESFVKTVDSQRDTLQSRIEELQGQMASATQDIRTELDARDRTIADLEQRVRDLTPPKTSNETLPDASLAVDGQIVSLVNERGIVYIDLGRSDRVIPGMTFEVYDKDTGVVKDEFGRLRGKVTIEVVTTEDKSSLARIVRRERNAQIQEGDLIANLVYDKNTVFKFFIDGMFDLDSVGVPSLRDRERIKALISRYGGKLQPDLSYDTDFLVLGVEPALPEPLPPDTIDPVLIEEHAARQRAFERHQKLIGEARALSIPIINQNRFLTMVGYYQR